MCLSKVKILIAKVLFVISALGTVIIIPVTVYGTGDSSRHKAVEFFNTPLVINEKRTFELSKKYLGDNRPNSYLTNAAKFFRKKTQGQNEFELEEMNVEFPFSEFYDEIDPDDPYVNIEKIKKKQKNTTDGQQPIVPVTNVPQQAGLEGVGVGHNPAPLLFPNNGAPPAMEDGAAGTIPAGEDGAVGVLLAREDGAAGTIPAGEDGAVGVLLAREDGAAGAATSKERWSCWGPPSGSKERWSC